MLWPRALLSSGTILDGVKNRGVLAVLAAKVECGVRAAQVLPPRGSSWWGYAMAFFFFFHLLSPVPTHFHIFTLCLPLLVFCMWLLDGDDDDGESPASWCIHDACKACIFPSCKSLTRKRPPDGTFLVGMCTENGRCQLVQAPSFVSDRQLSCMAWNCGVHCRVGTVMARLRTTPTATPKPISAV